MVISIDTTLTVPPSVGFRILSPSVVQVTVDGLTQELPTDLCMLALEFREPMTPKEMHASVETDATLHQFTSALQSLVRLGVLIPVADGANAGPSLREFFNPELRSPTKLKQIGAAISAGHAVAIPNALELEFAERTHASLLTCDWRAFERFDKFFHFHHHNVHNESARPHQLREAIDVFSSTATKKLLKEITDIDCDGRAVVGASEYLPGDYSLPHSDMAHGRTLAYVWHLAKDWNPEWGGHFFWGPTGAILSPSFNTLVIFQVRPESIHSVSTVAPHARSRRLSVHGWWLSGESTIRPRSANHDWPLLMLGGTYGDGSRRLSSGSDVILL